MLNEPQTIEVEPAPSRKPDHSSLPLAPGAQELQHNRTEK